MEDFVFPYFLFSLSSAILLSFAACSLQKVV